MPKAVANIVSVSPYHNLSAGDLADQLGAVKAEIAVLEAREKTLRDEPIVAAFRSARARRSAPASPKAFGGR
jgi:hypothetical protein